jgi:L-aspartate-L-methionine ligase
VFSIPLAMSDIWPQDAVIVVRPSDDSLDWLPQDPAWGDRASVTSLSFAGALPIVCHEAGVRPEALQLLQDCGLRLPTEVIPYRDPAHMACIVAGQIRAGRRIGVSYSSRRLLAPVEAYVNDPETVADLNDKANLADFLPAEAVPQRQVLAGDELPRVLHESNGHLPLVLKASSRLGSGGGYDVAICRSPGDLESARHKLAGAERVVVEAFYEFATTWCLHFAIRDSGVAYCGAAEQICDEGGIYHGNWCERTVAPAPAAIDFGRHAAKAGWSRGYRGFMGVDAGRTEEGPWLAFDLNFRNNGSTGQVLLSDSVAKEWGAACTRLCRGVRFNGTFAGMLDQLWCFHMRRRLIPLLTYDTEQLDTAESRPVCGVLLTGKDRAAVGRVVVELRGAGFELD